MQWSLGLLYCSCWYKHCLDFE